MFYFQGLIREFAPDLFVDHMLVLEVKNEVQYKHYQALLDEELCDEFWHADDVSEYVDDVLFELDYLYLSQVHHSDQELLERLAVEQVLAVVRSVWEQACSLQDVASILELLPLVQEVVVVHVLEVLLHYVLDDVQHMR